MSSGIINPEYRIIAHSSPCHESHIGCGHRRARLASFMNIYCLVTPSHDVLLRDWFLRTLPAACHAVPYFLDAPPEVFAEGNWHHIVAHKFEVLEQAFACEPEHAVFILSDVDLRFYGPFATDIQRRMQGMDILFQHNRPSLPQTHEHVCTGFVAVRNTPASRTFFRRAHAWLQQCNRPDMGDQNACIHILEHQPGALRFGYLPTTYWSPGSERGRWQPGLPLHPPPHLILHHANHTVGIAHKIAQLTAVEKLLHDASAPSVLLADQAA